MKAYPKMKDSGIEWIGKIPEHWDVEPIKYRVLFNHKELPEDTIPDLKINYIEISDVSSDGKISHPNEMFFGDAPSRARRVLSIGDTIISTVRTYLRAIGYIEKIKDNNICSTGFAVLSPSSLLHPKFLYYLARSEQYVDTIMANSVGVTYPAINSSQLSKFPLIIIEKEEQKQISDFLDSQTKFIDSQIESNQKLVTLLQEKRQATINQAVTKGLDPTVPMKDSGIEWIGKMPEHWICGKLGYFTKFISGFAFQSEKFYEGEDGIRLVRGDNVTEGIIRWGDKTRKWKQLSSELETFTLKENDVLIGMDGSKVGKNFAIVTKNDLPSLLVQRVARIRTKLMEQKFVYYLIGNNSFSEYINSVKTNVAIPHMSPEDIKNYFIPNPPLNEQKQISDYLDKQTSKIDFLISKTESQIGKLQEFRQSLISAVVTGKIDVRKEVIVQ